MRSNLSSKNSDLAVIRFADFECQEQSHKPVRLSLAVNGAGRYSVHRHEYGFGRAALSRETRISDGYLREHLAVDAFESEVVVLEQNGYDLVNERNHNIPDLNLSSLVVTGYKSAAYKNLSDDVKKALEGRHALRVHSGLHVVIVADQFMNVAMYPANRAGVEGCEIAMSKLCEMYMRHHAYKDSPEPTIVEGFYSECHGITLTDAIMVRGAFLEGMPFSQRYRALTETFPVQRSLFTDGVAQLVCGHASIIGETSSQVVNSPIFIIKSEVGAPTVNYGADSSPTGFSLIIDDDPTLWASAQVKAGELVLNGLYQEYSGVHRAVFTSSFFDCVNVAAYGRSKNRVPLLFF